MIGLALTGIALLALCAATDASRPNTDDGPTLRRSGDVPLWRGPCADCGMRGSSLMTASCPRCGSRPRAVSQ